jgi:hypothetical protein
MDTSMVQHNGFYSGRDETASFVSVVSGKGIGGGGVGWVAGKEANSVQTKSVGSHCQYFVGRCLK